MIFFFVAIEGQVFTNDKSANTHKLIEWKTKNKNNNHHLDNFRKFVYNQIQILKILLKHCQPKLFVWFWFKVFIIMFISSMIFSVIGRVMKCLLIQRHGAGFMLFFLQISKSIPMEKFFMIHESLNEYLNWFFMYILFIKFWSIETVIHIHD
mgnify:CR=1 FL=1